MFFEKKFDHKNFKKRDFWTKNGEKNGKVKKFWSKNFYWSESIQNVSKCIFNQKS